MAVLDVEPAEAGVIVETEIEFHPPFVELVRNKGAVSELFFALGPFEGIFSLLAWHELREACGAAFWAGDALHEVLEGEVIGQFHA